jgi:wyosine [tRNA(Phe)-imidazoG37] synthetase (radical SAM superfamily)
MQDHASPLITFGPVPSRRLGRSLGINNIPAKHCSYSCLYCQVGPTERKEDTPRPFYLPDEIRYSVAQRVDAVHRNGEQIDYLTLVPDGEPTLDVNLAETIDLLRPLGIKIAVISNASLIWRPEVQTRLSAADWVSLKVDATNESVWRTVNRPQEHLGLEKILNGIRAFAKGFDGVLTTETMLLAGINDDPASIRGVADFLAEVDPDKAYLAVPTRPPAEPDVCAPDELAMVRAYDIFKSKKIDAEYLVDAEGNSFALAGSAGEELLAITAVHPMRHESVESLLAKAGADWHVVDELESEGKLKRVAYADRVFYVRQFPRRVRVGG